MIKIYGCYQIDIDCGRTYIVIAESLEDAIRRWKDNMIENCIKEECYIKEVKSAPEVNVIGELPKPLDTAV